MPDRNNSPVDRRRFLGTASAAAALGGSLTPADAEWALNEWGPRVMAAGWKYWSVVLPEKVLGQMNMRRWIDTYAEHGVLVQAFSDPLRAMVWLKQQ